VSLKYSYLLFDLDGTLTDSGEGIMRCVQYALEKFGIREQDVRKLRRFVGPPLNDSFRIFCGMSEEDALQAVRYYRERYEKQGILENHVYEGIPQLLKDLAAEGRTLIVASSKPEVYVRKVLENFSIAESFSFTIGSGMNGRLSSKEEILAEVLRRCPAAGADRKGTVMIGDRRYDIEGARSAHIDSVGVYYGYAEAGELEAAGADYIVQTVDELRELFMRL
jgi:phosphoglycolate phosphatase